MFKKMACCKWNSSRRLAGMAALADSNATAEAKLGALQERHVHATSSYQFSVLPKARRSQELSKWRRHLGLRRSAFWRRRCASPIAYYDRVSALRLPAIYQWAEMAEGNGFVACGPRITANCRDYYYKALADTAPTQSTPLLPSIARLGC
jgi:hypothetical protein